MSKITQANKARKHDAQAALEAGLSRPHPSLVVVPSKPAPTPLLPRTTSWQPDTDGGDAPTLRFWEAPSLGDVVHCRFPDFLRDVLQSHERKTRPALVVGVQAYANGKVAVRVAYGTSQLGTSLIPGSVVLRAEDTKLGLAVDTRFDLRKVVHLPFDTEWFAANPEVSHGLHPKKGRLDLKDPVYWHEFSVALEDARRLGSELVDSGTHARVRSGPH